MKKKKGLGCNELAYKLYPMELLTILSYASFDLLWTMMAGLHSIGFIKVVKKW